jgi:pectate lyase
MNTLFAFRTGRRCSSLRTALLVSARTAAFTAALLLSAATAGAQSGTALVRHAPNLKGNVDGSIQLLSPEPVVINGNTSLSGALLVPGTPVVLQNGQPNYGGTVDAAGSASPAGYTITIGGSASLGSVIRRTDSTGLPAVSAPPAPSGTRKVTINAAGQSVGDFSTVRDLTVGGNAGQVAVPPGTYGALTASGGGGFTLGVAGALQPAVYNLQSLAMNGHGQLEIVGPVVLTVAGHVVLSGDAGSPAHPQWLMLQAATGDVLLRGDARVAGWITAPAGAVSLGGGTQLSGGLAADRLTVDGNGLLRLIANQPPSVTLSAPAAGAVFTAPVAITLVAQAGDSDGTVARVDFYADGTLVGSSTTAPYQFLAAELSPGVHVLTASATDNLGASTVSDPVSVTVNKAPATITLGGLSQVYDGTPKAASAATAPGGLSVALTYDGSAEAPIAAGSYLVAAVIDDPIYAGDATATLVIAPATPVVSWSPPADIVYGTALSGTELNATANVPGTFTYSPAAGTLLGAQAGATLSVTFAPADAANYTTAGATTTLTVHKAPAGVVLGGLSQTYNGTPRTIIANSVPSGLAVVVAYEGGSGAPINAGAYAVTGIINDPNYFGGTDGTLVIARATPELTWASPAAIVQGTPLTGAQLNASANVPGTFTYTPAAGTTLGVGTGQLLQVAFAPADAANYTATTATTTIDVTAPVPATITFDSVSSGTVLTATTTLTWNHTLGAGPGSSRALVVGVVSRGSSIANASVASVKFNGVTMTPLTSSVANAGSGTVNRSQLFFLLDAALPAAGTYPVLVTFGTQQSTGNNPSGGAISVVNVSQADPVGFSNNNTSANTITTTVPASAGSWVVDTVGVGSTSANLTVNNPGMVSRFNITQPGPNSAAAGATSVAGSSGLVTLSWRSSTARQVHSLAVFTPALSVPTAPAITTHPATQTVNVGTNVTLSVTATGTAPLSYQWFKNASPIGGATGSSLSLPNVQVGAAGSYRVSVTNALGSVLSNPADLTVNIQPPQITTQPISQTVNLDAPAGFSVAATGTPTLAYQWYHNGSLIPGATNPAYNLAHAQAADAGNYQVIVSNAAGPVPSDIAVLTVNTAPVAPFIITPPASQTAGVGANVVFTVVAGGTAPLFYQWQKDGSDIPQATTATLTLSAVQLADAGSYRVIISNIVTDLTSAAATLTVSTLSNPSARYDLTGFATLGAGTTGGGQVAETSPAYRKVYTALDLAMAIKDSKTVGAVKVIEIMNDLNLGWNEIGTAAQTLSSGPFRQHAAAKLHPALIASGVSLIDIQSKPGLTIFSANGATIKHASLNIKGTSNIIIRNLKFDELWEWDEASKGDYDSNDWDFIVLSNGSPATNIWIDHCTFTKAYDGIVDMKAGTQFVTLSWCRYVGDDGATNPNSFVRRQLAALEVNMSSHAFYNFLRTRGFSIDDIALIIAGHDKGHLMGSNTLDPDNATLSATFHHQLFEDIWDRCVPRLRAGQVHNYNIFVDDSVALVAKRLRDARANAMSSADRNTLNNTYSFNPFLNGSISTEGGAILVEKSVYMDCLTPLRNNQTDVNNPVYTGKILSIDSIYVFHETDGSTTIQRGDSTDAGSRMGPFQAAIIPFSWNTPDGTRPYPAPPMDDPAELEGIVGVGAGAGSISWSKDNWLKTNY